MKDSGLLLFVQPAEEFLKPGIGQNYLHRVESVAEFIVTPGLVDEILAGMERGHNLGSAFATRDYVMPSGGH